jgi:hypothetical protein
MSSYSLGGFIFYAFCLLWFFICFEMFGKPVSVCTFWLIALNHQSLISKIKSKPGLKLAHFCQF